MMEIMPQTNTHAHTCLCTHTTHAHTCTRERVEGCMMLVVICMNGLVPIGILFPQTVYQSFTDSCGSSSLLINVHADIFV